MALTVLTVSMGATVAGVFVVLLCGALAVGEFFQVFQPFFQPRAGRSVPP